MSDDFEVVTVGRLSELEALERSVDNALAALEKSAARLAEALGANRKLQAEVDELRARIAVLERKQ